MPTPRRRPATFTGRAAWRGRTARLRTGQPIEVDPTDPVGREILAHGCWERGTFDFLDRWLQPGMTVIDAGAHVGQYSILASARVGPVGCVHSFEPRPVLYRVLGRNLRHARCDNVVTHRLTLGRAPEMGDRRPGPIDDPGSTSLRARGAAPSAGGVRVKATSLDAYVNAARLARLDLVKLDVGGAELEALDGAARALAANPDVLLVVASRRENAGRSGDSAEAIGLRLRALGFWLFAITPRGMEPYAPGSAPATNVIAARRLELVLRGLSPREAALLLLRCAAAAATPDSSRHPRPAASVSPGGRPLPGPQAAGISAPTGRRGRAAAAGRYVVSRRSAGLGDLLVNLLAAWRFAAATGRTLVADWRFSPYHEHWHRNLFPALFEPIEALDGVPFVGDDRIDDLELPEPFHPAFWTRASLSRPQPRSRRALFADRDAAIALIRGGGDVRAPTVVLDACINHALPDDRACRRVLSLLRPAVAVRHTVQDFRDAHFGRRPVVALHVRYPGDPGLGTDHAPYWTDFGAGIARCVRAARVVRARLGGAAAVVFLSTDSDAVVDAVRSQIEDVVVRPKRLHKPGGGELHRGPLAFLTRTDALADMLLLAYGHVLVRYPPGSFFSFYASLLKPAPPAGARRGGSAGGTDPWAPAVVW